MRIDRTWSIVAASLVLSVASWAAPLNVATVGIGAPRKDGEYRLVISYVDANKKDKEFTAVVAVSSDDDAATKRDNLLAAIQTLLTNNHITAFTVAAAGATSITITSGAAPTKIINVQAVDTSDQANTYTINKQSTSDQHDAEDLLSIGPGGAMGGGLVFVGILGGSASVTTTTGMQGATIVSMLASQLVAAGVPNVATFGSLLKIGNIPSGTLLTVDNSDAAITVHTCIGESVNLPIPALPLPVLVALVAFALGGCAFLLRRGGRASDAGSALPAG